jgi:hypothetical protein
MRVVLVHGGRNYRFLNIESSTRDGSLSITIRRDGRSQVSHQWSTRPDCQTPVRVELPAERAKNKQITIHQSGRINFHETGKAIFVEPLMVISSVVPIYRYRIPRISRLTLLESETDSEDVDFDLSDLADDAQSFSLYVGPEGMVPGVRAVKLAYLRRYALVVALDPQPYVPPSEFAEHFVTLTPERGTADAQQMPEDQSLIVYHQGLHETRGLIIYGPNGAGVWQIVFAVPMRIPPRVVIAPVDSNLYVDDADITRDSRAENAMVRFKVRERATRAIIKRPIAFKAIELDAEL